MNKKLLVRAVIDDGFFTHEKGGYYFLLTVDELVNTSKCNLDFKLFLLFNTLKFKIFLANLWKLLPKELALLQQD